MLICDPGELLFRGVRETMLRKKKLYDVSYSTARRRGFTKTQWKQSKSAFARWSKIKPFERIQKINQLRKGKGLPPKQNIYEFKVYGYAREKGANRDDETASQIEGRFTYIGDKSPEQLEQLKGEFWNKIKDELLGTAQFKTLKAPTNKRVFSSINEVKFGFSELGYGATQSQKQTLLGEFASLGEGFKKGIVQAVVREKSLLDYL